MLVRISCYISIEISSFTKALNSMWEIHFYLVQYTVDICQMMNSMKLGLGTH